ncbi:hypothetical protein SAMN05421540_101191 [Psychroflexus halocasei]|uniref:Uncharacterized protein n=1 Tax=Psychroflexus halocasei TaxID=908615 RepID=A0A1H3VPQ0_9FLAO|nr:hypothetical protein SAMN05421540_101191 [Psychroflexus halocasei]
MISHYFFFLITNLISQSQTEKLITDNRKLRTENSQPKTVNREQPTDNR